MKLTFDPMTIQHLGFRMYSQLPNALAELIANSYDADATHVDVRIRNGSEPSVSVTDDGHGMSDEDLEQRYLTIGRNRVVAGEETTRKGRRVAGRKGLGKLAPFGIGTKVTVRTKPEGALVWTVVELDWDIMVTSTGEYVPTVSHEPGEKDDHGTTISITDLKRVSPIRADDLAGSIARLFNYTDSDFSVRIHDPEGEVHEVTRELRYAGISIEGSWEVPGDVEIAEHPVTESKISGRVISAKNPLPTHLRGLTVYVNGRLANDPEFFDASQSSFAAAYITGHIDADYLDDLSDDVIATDRRTISWETTEPAQLRQYLSSLLRKVMQLRRGSRKTAKKKQIEADIGVDKEAWVSSIRGPEARAVNDLVEALTDPDVDMSDEARLQIVGSTRELAPDHADLTWRHLHPSLQQACERHYRNGMYHTALVEAIKQYVTNVRHARNAIADGEQVPRAELDLMESSFSQKQNRPKVDIAAPWQVLQLQVDSANNFREAHKLLSTALWRGFRNPIQHVQENDLIKHEVITYQDCLDALSVLSHLQRRLDGAVKAHTENAAKGSAD